MRHAVLLRLFAGNVSSRGVPGGVGFAGTTSARALGRRPSQAPPVLLAGQVACWGDDVEFSSLGWPSWVAKRLKHNALTKPRRWYPVVAWAPKGAASGRSRPYSSRPRSNSKGALRNSPVRVPVLFSCCLQLARMLRWCVLPRGALVRLASA